MPLSVLKNMTPQPCVERALQNYRTLSTNYDATCTRIEALRIATVRELKLRLGETVFEIACGTGSVLPLLAREVGPSGRVVGVELSPEMATLARQRVCAMVDGNHVSVVATAMADFRPYLKADALLLCYAHDVLQSEASVSRLIAVAKPGARIALVGMQTLPWPWGWPVNIFNLYRARRYLTTYANLDRPWRLLTVRGASLRVVRTALWGSAYVVVGTFPARSTLGGQTGSCQP